MRPYLKSPALPQKLHRRANADPGGGSRHRNQNRRCTFQALRWLRIILKELESICCLTREALVDAEAVGRRRSPAELGDPQRRALSPCFRHHPAE